MSELSKRDKVFFETAKQLSSLSDHRCKIGCVVVDKHRFIIDPKTPFNTKMINNVKNFYL